MADSRTLLTLPVSSKDLSDFILKLLGRGRVIRKDIRRPFAIDTQGFINLHHGIEQRIMRQNRAGLSSFEAEFEFDDGHTYAVTSIDDFINHSFTQNQRCVRARFDWIYLVEFTDRPPEKQVIVGLFSTGQRTNADAGGTSDESPLISFSIEHTEVTWGYDLHRHIEHFLSAYVLTKKDRFAKIRTFITEFDRVLIYPVVMIVVMWSLAQSFWVPHGRIGPLPSGLSDIARVEFKLDFLVEKSYFTFPIARFVILITIGLTSIFAALWFAMRVLRAFEESAIFLNDNMRQIHKFARDRHLKSRCVAALGFAGATSVALFHHFIYDAVIKRLLH